MVHKSPEHFIKASDFSFKQHKWTSLNLY
jgi:hypothetical protein